MERVEPCQVISKVFMIQVYDSRILELIRFQPLLRCSANFIKNLKDKSEDECKS